MGEEQEGARRKRNSGMPLVFIVPIFTLSMVAFSLASMADRSYDESKQIALMTGGVLVALSIAVVVISRRQGPSQKKRSAGAF